MRFTREERDTEIRIPDADSATSQRVQFKVAVLVFQCLSGNTSTVRRLSAHHWHQHAPTPLDRHGDVCCSTVTQHIFGNRCFTTAGLDHACGTHYRLRYDNVTVSQSSNGCSRHTCSKTTALCDTG